MSRFLGNFPPEQAALIKAAVYTTLLLLAALVGLWLGGL